MNLASAASKKKYPGRSGYRDPAEARVAPGSTAPGTAVAAPNPAMKERLLTSTHVLRLNPLAPVYNPAGQRAGEKQAMDAAAFFFPCVLRDPVR
jgi:hypothetical protein